MILGLETSCDETAAAVVEDGHTVRSSVVSSQVDLHARFGGVVPEVASRAHVELITEVIAEALVESGVELKELDAVAACHGPGLAGALLVGVSAAKAIALAADLPYVGVNHLEAHLYAARLEEPDLEPPLAVLLVSGGHTMVVIMEGHGQYRVVGETVDDAAGEAFDKVARHPRARLSGWSCDRHARAVGDPAAVRVPAGDAAASRDFSFAGLKTAVVNHVRHHPDVCGRRCRSVVPGGGRRPAGGEAARRGRRGRGTHPRARRRSGGELPAPGPRGRGRRGERAAGLPPAPGVVHRQRGHDRRRGLVAAPGRRPDPARLRRAIPNLRLPES